MTAACGLTSSTSVLVPESKLSHRPKVQYGFVPKLSHHDWKKPRFALKNRLTRHIASQRTCVFQCSASGTVFFL